MAENETPEAALPGEETQTTEADAAKDSEDLAHLREELTRAQGEVAEFKDKILRLHAEMENMRRRSENDLANARKYAIERFAADLLNVRDSLELALSVELPHTSDPLLGKMLEGVVLTLKQLDGVFERHALVAVVPARGDKLDPERHQAMTTQASNEVPPGHILTLIQRGYLLNGRLLRPALVIVASAEEAAPGH